MTIAGFEAELTGEFFRAVAANAKLTLHLSNPYGANAHHMIEACFKAFARALRTAVAIDPGENGRARRPRGRSAPESGLAAGISAADGAQLRPLGCA